MTTLISFYTKDWQYPKHATRLASECEALGIPYVIEELPSTGSYLKNTCLKPQFILDKLQQLKSPVLWVDVDASVFQYPQLLDALLEFYWDTNVDFAARKMPEERNRTWHVGTMWFNCTSNMIDFLEHWIANTGNLSDESALEKTWQQFGTTIKAINLPPEYFYIQQRGKQPPADTVIMHRISNGDMKLREMSIAKEKREKGEW